MVADGSQHEVEALEERWIGLGPLDQVVLAPNGDAFARAALGSEQPQAFDGEIGAVALLQDA